MQIHSLQELKETNAMFREIFEGLPRRKNQMSPGLFEGNPTAKMVRSE